MDISKLRVNVDESNNGTWVDWIDDSRIKIRRWESAGYKEKLKESKALALAAKKDGSELTPQEDEVLSCELLAECVLVDWDGFVDGSTVLEYSVENAKQLLLEVPELQSFVMTESMKVSNFYKNRAEAAVKN